MTASALGLKYIIWGLFFLFNPNINIIDIFPDFIGYLLIIKGLYIVASIYPHFRDASCYFRNLAIISIAKTVSLPILVTVSPSEITWILVLAFVFGCLEIFYGFVAFSRLFEGIYYSAQRGDGKKVFVGYDAARAFTVFFACFKPIMSILPELTSLSNGNYGTVTDGGVVSYERFRIPFTIISAVLALAVGIAWLVVTRKYFKRVVSDNEYVRSLCDKYTKYSVETPELIERRTALSAISVFVLAAIFSLELKLDGINYIPNMVSGALYIAAFWRLRKIFPKTSRTGMIISCIYTAVSTVSWIFSVIFTEKYIIINKGEVGLSIGYGQQIAAYLGTNAEITSNFAVMCVLYAATSLLFGMTVLFVGKIFRKILIAYGGKPIYEVGQSHSRKVILRTTAVERFMTVLLTVVGFFSVAIAICQIVFVTLEGSLWLCDLVLRIIWLALFIYTTQKIRDSVNEKYIYIKSEGVS